MNRISKDEIKTFFRDNGKNIAKKTGLTVLVLVIIAAICLSIYCVAAYANLRISVDLGSEMQTVQGFGASMAWTFQRLGLEGTDEVKEQSIAMLYGEDGLRLNIARFNIGGGSADENLDDVFPYNKPDFDPDRRAESFFMAENFLDASDEQLKAAFADESNYDFTKCAVVDDMFEQALAKGNITHVVFFANSPHYLMTKNGKTHGEVEYDNNLKEEAYGAFADYLLVSVNYLYENIICKYDPQIKVYISPVNEPQWKWGGASASQEGCHYDPEPLGKFYDVFYDRLTAYNTANGTDYIMDIFECGKYQMIFSSANVKEYMNELSKYDWFDDIDAISVHSYGADNNKTDKDIFYDYMQRNFPEKKISVTEYCVLEFGVVKDMSMGIYNAQTILRDLRDLGAVSWSWWLSVSQGDYEDGLIYWNKTESGNVINKYKRYYVMGQFSRYIPEGSVRIEAKYSDFLGFNGVDCVAFVRPDGKTVLVVINAGNAEKKISLNGEFSSYTKIVTDDDHDWQESEGAFDGTLTLSPTSVTTYVLS